jgi:hypothetical protein
MKLINFVQFLQVIKADIFVFAKQGIEWMDVKVVIRIAYRKK